MKAYHIFKSGIVLLSLTALLPGCGSDTEVKTDSPMLEAAPEAPEYHLDNVLDTVAWLGRTAEEIGIAEEYVDGSSISFRGGLFDAEVYGSAYLLYHSGRDAKLVDWISLTCREISYPDAIAHFTELYGSARDMGEEPYAEVNGGAVEWQCFDTGAGTVKISQASNYDFFTIELTAKTLPDSK